MSESKSVERLILRYLMIAWQVAWVIPAYAARCLFCAMVAVFNLDWRLAVEAWNDTA
jgi:hypothetical protein